MRDIFVATADLHIASARPRYRIDNYEHTCCSKLQWIVNFTNHAKARLLIAGDLFDHTRISWELFNKVLDILKGATLTPCVVHGQHDILNHATDLNCSPLTALHKAGCIHLLDAQHFKDAGVYIYGAGFERNVPTPVDEPGVHILLTHTCITEGTPPFFLKAARAAKDVLTEYSAFDLIVSGDFHEAFQVAQYDRRLLNCGPMMRKNKDQMQLVPQVFLIDTAKRTYKNVLIPVQPPEVVFDVERMKVESEHGITPEVDMTKLKQLMLNGENSAPPKFEDVVEQVRSETPKYNYIAPTKIQQLIQEGKLCQA